MVPADETLEQALEREAWEEAGLELDRLEVHRGRSFQMRRPVPEGYQSEWIHVYETTLTSDTQCANQDGEVAAIERRPLGDVVDAIERGEFTLEAALVTLESLTRRSGLGSSRRVLRVIVDAVVLFFLLGVVARLARSDLRLPEALYETLSIYLLLAIGLKGGVELARQPMASRPAVSRWPPSRWGPRFRCCSIRSCGPWAGCLSRTAHRSPRTTGRCQS